MGKCVLAGWCVCVCPADNICAATLPKKTSLHQHEFQCWFILVNTLAFFVKLVGQDTVDNYAILQKYNFCHVTK